MTDKAIQVFKPYYRTEEIIEEVRECLDIGWTGLGYKTIKFEQDFKKYSGFDNAHFLNSATAGLELGLKVLKDHFKWDYGDEVITTALTFVSSNHAIIQNGLTPVFADVDEGLCLDINSIKLAVTEKTRAVMFVGLGGNVGQYESIVKFCREKGLKIILDAAHMAGTKIIRCAKKENVKCVHVGHDADVTVFSFQAVKNLPTADSGMICFRDKALDSIARKLSWLGIDKDTFSRSDSKGTYNWDYDVIDYGFKSHGNSIMASLGIVGLRYLDEDNERRRQIASIYSGGFKGNPNIIEVPHSEKCVSSRHLFQVRVKNRDKVMSILNLKNIFPGVHYKDNSNYKIYAQFSRLCPNAALAGSEVVSLPLHLRLTDDDIHYIIQAVKEAVIVSE